MKLFEKLFGSKPKPTIAMTQLAAAQLALGRASDPRLKAALQRDIDELGADVAFDELTQSDPQVEPITVARDQLHKLGDLLAGRAETAASVQMVIQLAIHHGAPIYNAGSHIGCACIYDYAARLVLRLLEKSAGEEMQTVSRRFAAASFQPITPLTATKRAWELRSVFDDTMATLSVPGPVEISPHAAGDMEPAGRKLVFVSHAKPDHGAALQLVNLLEAAGLQCWIAPRDIPYGSNYAGAIMDAIKSADAMLVLLSSESNSSQFVSNEIERAVNYSKRVVPVRVEPVLPSANLELFIGARQWIDFWDGAPNREENLRRLIGVLRVDRQAGRV
jgi:hypothetical protein